jgi:hypothetical protein
MKDTAKILLIALPFSWFAGISISYLGQLGIGIWLLDTLSIKGYWPVTLIFYVEDFLNALLTVIPYVGLIYFSVSNNKLLTVTTSIFAYVLFTFLLCYHKEQHLTPCLFTLVQSAHIAVYAAIIVVFALFDGIWGKSKSAQ